MNFFNKVLNRILRGYLSERYDDRIMLQSQEIIDLHTKIKIMQKQKIHVVFVCHRAALWNALKSVYEACMADEAFDVTIVAIPNKKQLPKIGLAHEEYVSEGAEEFFSNYKCRVINGYDYENKVWFDLRKLEPDYLFFQTGYDICRPPQYKSDVVALYTKLCYVHYGMPFMGGMIAEESFPVSFLKNTYFHFAEFEEMRKYYVERVSDNAVHKSERVLLTGYPKLDEAQDYIGCESDSWIYKGLDKKYRVMWTPRWNTEEHNCTFFDYKDKMVQYFKENKELEMLFRPHPQAFSEYIASGQMTVQQVRDYKSCYEETDNISMDKEREYLASFYSSDVLITDESSIIPEYFLTGKPIIFTYKETHLNKFAETISKGFYWAKNWDELVGILNKLKNGEDSLAETRKTLIDENFYLPEKGSGYEIKEAIKRDFYKNVEQLR